jgi:hypothetical protein
MPAVRELENICSVVISVVVEREPRHDALTKIIFKLPFSSGRRRPDAKDKRHDRPVPLVSNEPNPGRKTDRGGVVEQHRTTVPQTPPTSDVSLFIAPPIAPSSTLTLKGQVFKTGIELLAGNGVQELTARTFLGKLLSDYDDGFVLVVLTRACMLRGSVADLRSWIRAKLKRYPDRASDLNMRRAKTVGNARPNTQRPLATPENLGLSPGLVAKIRANNKKIEDFSIFDAVTSDAGAARVVSTSPWSSPATPSVSDDGDSR